MKLISGNAKNDRWDQLLEKTIHHPSEDFHKDDEFAFFDSADEGDRVFMNDEKLVVLSNRRDDDLLKQIFEKEFSPLLPHEEETSRTIQKPPRKSLENRKSLESLNSKRNTSNYSSRSSMRFDD